ncbi:MAG: peptide chain release factor 3 [Candidatus Poriferisodalaceae bacterium]
MTTPELVAEQALRRRTFAIISHPDAGKTTLTEKFLLYSGQIAEAGSVKARSGRRSATSDWMELEQQRGISITSTALQFQYRDRVLNLLDTPGHRDFSEDTYRVLAATDAAIMVIDGSKGIEPQTLKLFEVCRQRELPILTFINKCDRPGREALELIDEIENTLQLLPTPMSWPVGVPGDLRGIVDRATNRFIRYDRTAHGAKEAPEEIMAIDDVPVDMPGWAEAHEELELLDAMGGDVDMKGFLAGEVSPVFFGSALTNFGVRLLLDAVVDLSPSPAPRPSADGEPRALAEPFSAFAFKVQANMDRQHRDRIAFVRVCSGHFERGMTVTQARTGKPFATKYAHSMFGSDRETIDEAWPGDVVGLVNATDVRVGDTLYAGSPPVEFPGIPSFAPELFRRVRVADTSRYKQFRRGLVQLDEEGVIQVLRDEDIGDVEPILAAVGQMQFEVAMHRLDGEFGAPSILTPAPYSVARRTDEESAAELRRLPGATVMRRSDGMLLALFENEFYLQRIQSEKDHLTLERILAEQEQF